MNKDQNILQRLLHILMAFLLFGQTSCSVIAAASGTPEPNMEIVKAGSSRVSVEQELGPPVTEEQQGSEARVQYTYKIGDEPAIGRAFLYLIGDIFTLFLFEYIAFPLEISNSGNAHDIEVTYGADNTVRSFQQKKPSAPLSGSE